MNHELLLKNIKELCKKQNISVSELEDCLKFSPSLISRWKDKNPNIDRIIDIAKFFHVSLDELIGFDCNENMHDEFVEALISETQNGNFEWRSKKISKDENVLTYNLLGSNKLYDTYTSEKYEDATFYVDYMAGYISLYSVYKIGEPMEVDELYLSIQPKRESSSKLLKQKYDKNEILPLYLKVLLSLNNEAPDEIIAELMKASLINQAKK